MDATSSDAPKGPGQWPRRRSVGWLTHWLVALSQGAEAVGLIPEWDRLPHREKVPKVTGCFLTPRLGQI